MRVLSALVGALFLAGCGADATKSTAVEVSDLKAALVQAREVELTYSVDALVEAVRQSTVSAQIAGRIVDVRFDVGDHVKKGEVLLRIDERAVSQAAEATSAQAKEAEAALQNARAQHERAKQLLAQNFISQAALDRAESEHKAAQARYTALLAGAGQAETERSFATVLAPYSGVVAARHVELGEMAAPGKALLTGFDPTTLRVVASVPQAQVAAIQAGAKARIEVPATGKWLEVRSVTVLPAADPRTHTTLVRLDLPAAAARGVHPGVFARVHFVTGKAPRLLVPREAIVRRSEVTAVYVLQDRTAPLLRQIRLGSAADQHAVEVLAGLLPGERVALEPVKAGMASRPAADR